MGQGGEEGGKSRTKLLVVSLCFKGKRGKLKKATAERQMYTVEKHPRLSDTHTHTHTHTLTHTGLGFGAVLFAIPLSSLSLSLSLWVVCWIGE